MKTRLLIIIGLISLSGFTIYAHANELSPVGVTIINYGIFDPNENNTHELTVGQKYNIKVHFKSDLDTPVSFTYFVQVLDRNKHWTETVEEFRTNGVLQPNEEKFFSFTWTPEYEGQFRTFSEIYDDGKNTTIGGVPQFDFQVSQPDKNDPDHVYFPTYRIMNLNDEYLTGESIEPYVLKKDLNACNGYRSKIIIEDTRQQVWEYQSSSSCVVLDSLPEIESKIDIPTNQKPIILNKLGNYVLKIDMGTYELQKRFSVVGKYSLSIDDDYALTSFNIAPLKQFKSGIAIDEIQCKESLILVTKHDGSPACVKPETKIKLIERGWVQHDRESDKIIINYMSDVIQSNKNGIVTYDDKWTFIEKTITENNLESFTEMYFQDLKKEYQNDEKITFNLELFGYYPSCIFPSLSLYVDEYPQDPIYTRHVVPHTCPFSLENKPVIKSWDESDFRFFPICKYQGKYTIVGNAPEFDRVIGSFTCNGEKEFKPPKTVKIIIPQGASDPLLKKNFDPSQITLNWGDYIMFVNQDDVSYRITTSYHDLNVGKSYFTLNGGELSNPMKIKYDGTHWLSSKTYPYDKTSIVPWMNASIYMN
ncbi:MAG: hypothetical protein IIC67_07805 [Thaumarchaeota archaeon]|nr:hypothetical protein [Nitrososphaerota archaeon]